MMRKRWNEEISQTELEMETYLKYLVSLHSRLRENLAIQEALVQSWKDLQSEPTFHSEFLNNTV